jgi:hypothetical protein
MSRRIDSEILERTFQENKDEFLNDPTFASAFEKFQLLRSDLQNASTSPLRHLLPLLDDMKNDPVAVREYDDWQRILSPYVDKDVPDTWLSAPWMVAEFYLYRRLTETLDYFNPKSPTFLYDPFAKQKLSGLGIIRRDGRAYIGTSQGFGTEKPARGSCSFSCFCFVG